MSHIKEIKPSTIKRALRLHKEWLDYKEGNNKDLPKGKKLVVTTNLVQRITFRKSDLFKNADFRKVNFSGVNFSYLSFHEADFSGANFFWSKVLRNKFL